MKKGETVLVLPFYISNKNGWEFAFGPNLNLISVSKGYYHNGEWRQANNDMPPGQTLVKRMDIRGNVEMRSAFVLAFGKSFRSGKLNIPVNGYIVPSKEGARVGASFGFNTKNK